VRETFVGSVRYTTDTPRFLMELDPNLALALVAIAMPASIIVVLKSFASGR